MTATNEYVLRVDLGDWAGNTTYAMYSNFSVGGLATNYTLHSIGNYSGTAGEQRLIYPWCPIVGLPHPSA